MTCTNWTGDYTPTGMPRLIRDGNTYNAQRITLETHQPSPVGPHRCHATCGNQACVNVEHLTWMPVNLKKTRTPWDQPTPDNN